MSRQVAALPTITRATQTVRKQAAQTLAQANMTAPLDKSPQLRLLRMVAVVAAVADLVAV
jgi:hypothetical protein